MRKIPKEDDSTTHDLKTTRRVKKGSGTGRLWEAASLL